MSSPSLCLLWTFSCYRNRMINYFLKSPSLICRDTCLYLPHFFHWSLSWNCYCISLPYLAANIWFPAEFCAETLLQSMNHFNSFSRSWLVQSYFTEELVQNRHRATHVIEISCRSPDDVKMQKIPPRPRVILIHFNLRKVNSFERIRLTSKSAETANSFVPLPPPPPRRPRSMFI